MSYVILQPHSNTNPTARYMVVDFDQWVMYRAGIVPLKEAGSSTTYSGAVEIRDKKNREKDTRIQHDNPIPIPRTD